MPTCQEQVALWQSLLERLRQIEESNGVLAPWDDEYERLFWKWSDVDMQLYNMGCEIPLTKGGSALWHAL
jgi:hypothetical protein